MRKFDSILINENVHVERIDRSANALLTPALILDAGIQTTPESLYKNIERKSLISEAGIQTTLDSIYRNIVL